MLKLLGIVVIFFPTELIFTLSTPLAPLLSLPGVGINLDQTPSNHFSSGL